MLAALDETSPRKVIGATPVSKHDAFPQRAHDGDDATKDIAQPGAHPNPNLGSGYVLDIGQRHLLVATAPPEPKTAKNYRPEHDSE